MRGGPIVLGVGASTGVGIGLALGPFLLGWGLVAASVVAFVFFALGLRRDPGDLPLRNALLGLGVFGLAFVASSAPVTLSALNALEPGFAADVLDPLEVASVDEARRVLATRWAALGAVALASFVAAWRFGSRRTST